MSILTGNARYSAFHWNLRGRRSRKGLAGIDRDPYGQTRTYREIAERIGNPKAARAVGMANNRNPAAVRAVPPWIGADGSLVGYAGGLDIKKKLLDLERMHTPGKMTGGNEVSI